jgi:hypothetical protein
MDENRETAPPTPGSAEGERDPAEQSTPSSPRQTPGAAEGERDIDAERPVEGLR